MLQDAHEQVTHETAPTQFVEVGDIKVAYRRFGKRGALPLLLLNYFAANIDDWDPRITNGFAAVRDVAWKAQLRLCARYRRLSAAGKPKVVVTTAIAREMVGFIWAIALIVQSVLA